MNIGLFFGSFNPIHVGHLLLANYFREFTNLQEIWFVVSPQNPLKRKRTLLNDFDRYDMVSSAIENFEYFKVSDIEFRMPKPSYTIDTLTYLSEKYPNYHFYLILGADNLRTFNKWKNYEEILKNYNLLVYPRPGYNEKPKISHENIKLISAPQIEISSSFIRKAIKGGKDIQAFLPDKVYEMIKKSGFYLK